MPNMSWPGAARRSAVLRIAAVAVLAVCVHGYHLGVDDGAIYAPAVKRAADPALYPFGSQFFMSHARLSVFAGLVGGSARIARVSADAAIFAWHVLGVFLLLTAAWRLLCACFDDASARWCGVALLAALLSVPVAGTALVVMDPYLTARSLSTPASLFAIAEYVSKRPWRALAWLVGAGLVHPQMGFYTAALLSAMALAERSRKVAEPAMALGAFVFPSLPFLFALQPAQGPAREALLARTYFFLGNWAWYEWIGVLAPLALLWWFRTLRPAGVPAAFQRLSRSLVWFGLAFTACGVALSISPRLENYTRLQPMRAFHIVYVAFFALLGGLLGRYALRRRVWLWAGLFVPLAASMWMLQQSAYPSSPHIEWPGAASRNDWVTAFLWIRGHTPKNAVFALDPDYMRLPGEDQHGFRAVAERSVLADELKDSGAVSLFPQLADEWKAEVVAQTGWEHFQAPDFARLAARYPVTWVVTRPHSGGLACPYENRDVAVCRIGPQGRQRL